MSEFLPKEYEIPTKNSNYYKFVEGANRFRILASPIVGWLYWTEADGKKKPNRKKMTEKITEVEPDKIKHFWAMPVWDYAEEQVKILELTQKGIQKKIKAFTADEDWGSPLQYDLVVTRTGQELLTEYECHTKPAKPLDEEVAKKFAETPVDLNKLFSNEDPFEQTDPEIDIEKL